MIQPSFGKVIAERRAFLDWYKTSKGCEECGYNAFPEALQLDHLDPKTKYRTKNGKTLNPGEMIMMSQSIFFAELKKCRVICANCHAVHTKKQQAEIRMLKKIAKMSEGHDRMVA
jgi:hypothetical protein